MLVQVLPNVLVDLVHPILRRAAVFGSGLRAGFARGRGPSLGKRPCSADGLRHGLDRLGHESHELVKGDLTVTVRVEHLDALLHLEL